MFKLFLAALIAAVASAATLRSTEVATAPVVGRVERKLLDLHKTNDYNILGGSCTGVSYPKDDVMVVCNGGHTVTSGQELVIPKGTTVYMYGGITVNSGGRIVAQGTEDNEIYTSSTTGATIE